MTVSAQIKLSTFAFALASAAICFGGTAYADDAMKPATEAMKPADTMKADKMMEDCKEKAGMETDTMKKDEAMKACDNMAMKGDAMKGDAMKPADNAMKPASSN